MFSLPAVCSLSLQYVLSLQYASMLMFLVICELLLAILSQTHIKGQMLTWASDANLREMPLCEVSPRRSCVCVCVCMRVCVDTCVWCVCDMYVMCVWCGVCVVSVYVCVDACVSVCE